MSKYTTIINDLLETYADNEHMLKRIDKHLTEMLPATLLSELRAYEEKQEKNIKLSNEQEIFVQIFLIKNKYFYLSQTNSFYQYKGTYGVIKIDDVIHNLLQNISKEKILMEWKHKTKNVVIKMIKDRSLFSSVPDSYTIQLVFRLLSPLVSGDKTLIKYILAVVGDCIMKKNTRIFLVNANTKKCITFIESQIKRNIGGIDIGSCFVTKYHETHELTNCRILNIRTEFNENIWYHAIGKNILDIICVACHYSSRYETSDQFIFSLDVSDDVRKRVMFLANISKKEIFAFFCDKYLYTIHSDVETSVGWSEIAFVWKHFLNEFDLPSIIYTNALKSLMNERFDHKLDSDEYMNVSSHYLPMVSIFNDFWGKTMTSADDDEYELELSEVCLLFKLWLSENLHHKLNHPLTEDHLLKILDHFYPNVVSNINLSKRYLTKLQCSLWNKGEDINRSLDYTKGIMKGKKEDIPSCLSFDDLYTYYYSFTKTNNALVVSKNFFEKYLIKVIPASYVLYGDFIDKRFFI